MKICEEHILSRTANKVIMWECFVTQKLFDGSVVGYLLSHTVGSSQDVRAVDQRTATELSPTIEQSCLDSYANGCGSWPYPGIHMWRELKTN
jgi:hypothetical protein